jgi:membrane-associated phospholipid phosphatase
MTARSRLQRLDERLFRRCLRSRSPALDRRLVALSRAANYSRLWLVIALALRRLGGAPGRRAAESGTIALAIAAAVANAPAKLLVRRRRPVSRVARALIPVPRSNSFPSGHSATAFAFAAGASLEQPALAPVLVPLAGAVAYSRVYTGVHYPSDVAAGAAVGLCAGALVAYARRLQREPLPLSFQAEAAA